MSSAFAASRLMRNSNFVGCNTGNSVRIDSVMAKEFGEHLSKVLNGGHYKLVIELHGVTYVCRSGFRQLLIVKNSTQSKNVRIATLFCVTVVTPPNPYFSYV